MSPELIAIVGTVIALGVTMFASMRWACGSVVESVEKRLDNTDGRINGAAGMLRAEMKDVEGRLRNAIKATEDRLDGAICGLRADMMTAGVLNLTDRVPRVEGVIAGAYPGVRNQAQEHHRKGRGCRFCQQCA